MGGVYRGLAEYKKVITPSMDENMADDSGGLPGGGLFAYEYICEGDTVVGAGA